ncbi:PIG-L family deacetylase [Mucilaginibacter sp. E4BP6]|uniref:PIG-L family deacetylase n=1 Tax=Mucilaginibacter sp. E4BP6 TaxID=2723089 RepID=UPI0015CDC1C8|nr:PIG-L family deacetylase [Mucilaginibacter sp. E4BP6]NYE68403.1 hypothetical protein [Mucilaginibacter sp. E4BP6]
MITIERVSIYIVAHQDDWQLFMNPQVGQDINDKRCKTIIIHTTAGDAGKGKAYWKAREYGAIASVRFSLSANRMIKRVDEAVQINGRFIHRVTNGNCVCYFMRIPDGGYKGAGFKKYNFQSLEKLRTFSKAIDTVDKNLTYESWEQLGHTVNMLIEKEIESVGDNVVLNMLDFDRTLNPKDHCDHLNSSLLLTATSAYEKFPKRAFLTYCTFFKDENLIGEELVRKVGMFTAYDYALYEKNGHSTFTESAEYFVWATRRSFFRNL